MKKIKMPDTFVIIFFVVIFASLLTYIVPVGKFEMQEVTYITNTGAEKTRNVPVPGSFSGVLFYFLCSFHKLLIGYFNTSRRI